MHTTSMSIDGDLDPEASQSFPSSEGMENYI